MPRESISMSPNEVVEFLKSQRWAVLGTLDADGSPWADAVACLTHEDRLYFRVPRGTRSYANIRGDDRVCCIVDQYPTYNEIKGVIVHGRTTDITDQATSTWVGSALQNIPDPIEPRSPGGALYSLPLDDVTSFDFSKIKNKV